MSAAAENLRTLNRAVNQAIQTGGRYDLDSIRRYYHVLLIELASTMPAAPFHRAVESANKEFGITNQRPETLADAMESGRREYQRVTEQVK